MDDKNTCALCARPLGERIEMHHLIPKSKGGREVVALHPICHRKIHALFNEKELEKSYNTIGALRQHAEIKRFVSWLKGKPPDFHRRTEPAGGRTKRTSR
ncbi:HNH endonuclease [Kordiimonas marina]|uniref:HNH endonuclease n=1 Tax=Kordiimonas marina TaxID=2872312 RepID=UPI001FF28E17|nr:HNH endonuclease [Kordiimonas marina]MCJ9428482.1 HNH endonuclease [Kordiimonas marina]